MKPPLRLVIFLIALLSARFTLAQADTRPFYMGFTPFPYEISMEAINFTYSHIGEDADLILQHFDNGVPWVEALSGAEYSQNIRDDWNLRRSLTPKDHLVYVSATPINFVRTGLAAYRGQQDDMPLPAPFDNYGFDHPDVLRAYLQYCQDLIAYFEPDTFIFSIEANLLMKLRPDLWESYMTLHRAVYTALKASHPDLPLVVSVTGIDLLEGYTDANHQDQQRALTDLVDYTDILGLSVYPYMTDYMTNVLPERMFDELASLTDKPLAITETGYPAQSFGINVEGGQRLEFESDSAKQEAYIQLLLNEAQQHEFRFVIHFVLRDYDALWRQIGAREDLTIAWRDTGLYDEDGGERPALAVWREWLARPAQPVVNEATP